MSSTTVAMRMGTSPVVSALAAGGCNDSWWTATISTTATATISTTTTTTTTTTGGDGVNNGSGDGISRVSVRRATLSEACSVTSMVNDAYRHNTALFAVEGSTRVTPDGTQVTALMENPCNAFLVAEEKNIDGSSSVMVGCVHVNWSGTTVSKDPSVGAHISFLGVPERYSGRGIGTLLISAAEEWCRRELGRRDFVIELAVMSIFPRLCVWYKTLGYEMGKIIPFPTPGKVREGIDLKLQLMTKTSVPPAASASHAARHALSS